MRIITLFATAVLAALAATALWIGCNRPLPVEPSWSQPLRSVSFAPFRRGQSPLTKVYPTPGQVEEDLKSLVGMARGLRTYTSREGMQVVPDLAAKYGLKVTFGAWLGGEADTNAKEVDALIQAANAHPQEIERVIVGNEVLLRRDLKPEQLIAEIRKVRAAIKQPVSYADVWAFYLKYPEVGREVDYITIHILPFWEDEPVDIDHVEEHVLRIVERIRQAFPGKPILIGEAGWPSIGRDRGPAVVSTVNEARFVRKMAQIAEKYDFDYNIVEAFDQPWKSALENTVGAAWGILDIDRRPKFPLSGPVAEISDWRLRAGLAVGGGLLASLLLGWRLPGTAGRLVFALLAQTLSWLTVTTAFHVEAVSFVWWQDLWAILRGGLPLLFALEILRRAADLLADPALAVAPAAPLDPLGGHGGSGRRWGGEALALLFGLYALVWTALLAFDGRYRDIPDIDFSVPCLGMTLLLLLRAGQARRLEAPLLPALALEGLFARGPAALTGPLRRRLTLWLAHGLRLAAAAAILSEGFAVIGEDFAKDHPTLAEQVPLILRAMWSNREMLLWAAMLLVMALPYAASLRLRRRQVAAAIEAPEAAE